MDYIFVRTEGCDTCCVKQCLPVCTRASIKWYLTYARSFKNPISRFGGVALTRYIPPPFFVKIYKLNYLPFQILDSDHISSCTSVGSVLQLYKVSQKSNKPFRRSCAYKVHGRTDGQTDARTDRVIPVYPPNFVYKKKLGFDCSMVRTACFFAFCFVDIGRNIDHLCWNFLFIY